MSAGVAAVEAALQAERETRVTADTALTRELNTAKSRLQTAEAALQAETRTRAEADRAEAAARQTLAGKVDGNTAALAEIRETKADKTQVGALARQVLSVEWQRDIDTAKTQAQQVAAEAAQAKADAAQRAAEQAAERLATAKANAAQAAAIAAASGDATAKANAAEARAKADAARAVAEAAQRTADTVATDLVREQQTRAAGDEANVRDIRAANARLGTAESNINELRQTTARQGQALAEAQSSLSARIDGVAADATVGGNLVADGALKQADLWRSHFGHNHNIVNMLYFSYSVGSPCRIIVKKFNNSYIMRTTAQYGGVLKSVLIKISEQKAARTVSYL